METEKPPQPQNDFYGPLPLPAKPSRVPWLFVGLTLLALTGIALHLRINGSPWTAARGLASLSPLSPPSPQPEEKTNSLTRTELNNRIRAAIERTAHFKVAYDDVLGEGPDRWDSHPRYPKDTVNCIVWITHVLAEAYGRDLTDKTPVLDRLRYYEGTPAFGLRKHYNAHWVQVEPEPLRKHLPQACGPYLTEAVDLELEAFTKAQAYACPLYRMDQKRISYQYLSPSRLEDCAPQLDPGFYVVFGVATQTYTEQFGKKSGPMGLVHGMFLEVNLAGDAWIHHASTSAKKIKREKLEKYIKRMRKELHKGYTIYELSTEWNPQSAARARSFEADQILACELNLPHRRPDKPAFPALIRD